jgi:hypothetical protein
VVADHLQFSNENLQLNLSFIILVQDWELDSVTVFFELLYSLKMKQGGKDSICWIPSKGQKVEEKSFYQALSIWACSPFS